MTLILVVLAAMTFSDTMDTAKTVFDTESRWLLASVPDTFEEYGVVIFTAGITASYVRHGFTWQLAGIAVAMWLGSLFGAEIGGRAARLIDHRLDRKQ